MAIHDDNISDLPNGLYDALLTRQILDAIESFDYKLTTDVDTVEFAQLLSDLLSRKLPQVLKNLKTLEDRTAFANKILGLVDPSSTIDGLFALKALIRNPKDDRSIVETQPELQLSDFALLTNAHGEPSMLSQLREELSSADAVDILIAFVFQTGLNTFADLIKQLRSRGARVRLITGVYRGSSEQKAIDYLVRELGVEVKINYETHKNHLHAKSWIIHRNSGFSTAFVGSSNISVSAMETGLEWNVRLTKARSPHVLRKLSDTFETYWSLPGFELYDPDTDGERLSKALSWASGNESTSDFNFFGIDVLPKPHQVQMLQDLVNERAVHDRHKNLVVAATGTGKTVLAALDYQSLIQKPGQLPKLLFVAHRKEILQQARATFRAVLKNGDFGEIWADGEKPIGWNHVFASVQSLSGKFGIEEFSPDHFQVVIIDEFHRAEAKTYRKVMDHFKPTEFLGLTATPERSDGVRVQDAFFDGRIASELRLWDAMDSGLLAPFHYFGIGESTDYSKIDWKSGGYDQKKLSNLITGNEVRDRLVLREVREKIANPLAMKALVFCASIEHAEHVHRLFNYRGIIASLVTGSTDKASRKQSIVDLRHGEIQAIVTVDVFNEGVDIPEVDTVIMLRPTESPVVFLQQLGRGLRLAKDKSVVTVLDFVGSHRAEYRNDLKLSAMTGVTRGKLEKSIQKGFPYLPAGMVVALDPLAREHVLANLKNQVKPSKKLIESEIAAHLDDPNSGGRLGEYLESYGRELDEVYRHCSWLEFCSSINPERFAPISESERTLLKPIIKLMHVDDTTRLDGYSSVLDGRWDNTANLSDYEQRVSLMFYRLIWPDGRDFLGEPFNSVNEAFDLLRSNPRVVNEMLEVLEFVGDKSRLVPQEVKFKATEIPLFAGATYLRDEILAATGWATENGMTISHTDKARATKGSQGGIISVYPLGLDALFITLNKDEKVFSATTRYQDFALSSTRFHWESPNSASVDTELGKRIVAQIETGDDVLIAIQENKGEGFYLAGLADLESFEGGNPIRVTWKLRTPLSPRLFKVAATANVA